MRWLLGTTAAIGMSIAAMGTAHADNHMMTGDELQGHTVDVAFSDGTTNSIFFGSNGQALVSGPDGATMNASWFVQDDQICLQASGSRECWGYSSEFAAGQPVAMESSCDAASQWTARSVNTPMAAPVMMGERG
ncbi:MAG: hypothetical protein R3D89_06835 [Sphingomonadaceae bacterium]